MKITFNIPSGKAQIIVDTMIRKFPIPKIPDPNWVDPKDGTGALMINEFTDNQWAKEAIRRWIITECRERLIRDAKDAVDVSADNNLIT